MLGQRGGHARAKSRVGVQSGAHRRTADGKRLHRNACMHHGGVAQRQLRLVAAELLAQSDGRGVLQVRAAQLHHIGIGGALGGQRSAQFAQRGHQQRTCLQQHRQVHGAGENVVRALPQIDIVIRVHRLCDALFFERGAGQ